jgi:hypothetical protein
MRNFARLLTGSGTLAVLLSLVPAPAAADFTTKIFKVPCHFCSLPGTWVFRVPTDGPAGQTNAGYSLFTFDAEGTLIVTEGGNPALNQAAFHGVWTRVDTFRYSMSAVRPTPTGWQRIRVVVGYDDSCNKLKGDIKVDTLTCANVNNGTCDPQGGGWVLTPGGTNPDGSWDIFAKRYQRYPFTYNPWRGIRRLRPLRPVRASPARAAFVYGRTPGGDRPGRAWQSALEAAA